MPAVCVRDAAERAGGANGCIPGDFNQDDVDRGEFTRFAACLNGPNSPSAERGLVVADLDGDVSLGGYSIFPGPPLSRG